MIWLSSHLAVGYAPAVGLVEGVLGVGAGLGVELDDVPVDEGELDCPRLEPAVAHAAPVVHVEVDVDDLGHEGAEDVEHAPLLAVDVVEVELPDHLVDVVQQLDGEVLEGGELAALAVDLQEDVPLEELVDLDHVGEAVELLLGRLLGDLAHADVAEVVVAAVGVAGRHPRVGAVEHVVGHALHRRELAAEVVVAVYPDVYDPLAVLHEVLADQVAPVRRRLVPDPRELAVGVLSRTALTL